MLWVSMRGTVTRWGTRGYGFIRPDDSDLDAWVHYRFLAEPDWVPRGGERVEFELKERVPSASMRDPGGGAGVPS